MGKVKLTKREIIVLLVTIRSELKILFEELGLEQFIVKDLTTLLEKEFNIDPEREEIYKIFDK